MHPSNYTTVPFGAMRVMEVDPGTVIKDERSGEEITVDDETIAVKGAVIWCTKRVVDQIRGVSDADPARK
jgi:hypothetical protein